MQRNLRYNDEQNNGFFAKLRAFGTRSIGITVPSTMRKTLKLYPGQIVWVTVSVVKVEDDKSREGQRWGSASKQRCISSASSSPWPGC